MKIIDKLKKVKKELEKMEVEKSTKLMKFGLIGMKFVEELMNLLEILF